MYFYSQCWTCHLP